MTLRSAGPIALLLAGCGGGGVAGTNPPPPPPAPPPAPVASVTLSHHSASLTVGATLQLAAAPKDAQGNVLAGRTVSWSSTQPAVASVSGNGLVTAFQVGQSRIVAAAEGKSDTATVTVSPGPVQVTLLSGASRTDSIGPAGGTIVATAGGRTYSLVIPALALAAPVRITLTPIQSVSGLPLSGGFAGGADFQPSGLVFAVPATLTITGSPAAGIGQHLVGFGYEGTGAGLVLAPAAAAGGTVRLSVSHFSGVGAGFGTVQDVEALWLGVNVPPTSSAFYAGALTRASGLVPRDGAFELQIMEDWFDDVILPMLQAVSTDAQLIQANAAYVDWVTDTPDLLGTYGVIPGGGAAPSLTLRQAQWKAAFLPKAKQAISGNEQLCASPGLVSVRVAGLDNALFWYRVLRVIHNAATAANGLDLPSFQAGLCARSVTENLTLPDPLAAGGSTLDATFKLIFTGGQVIEPANFFVDATGSGATLQLPTATALTPAGFYTGSVRPASGATVVTVDLKACYAGNSALAATFPQGFFDELCHTEHLVRQVPLAPPPFNGVYQVTIRRTNLVTGGVTQSPGNSYRFTQTAGASAACFGPDHVSDCTVFQGTVAGNVFTGAFGCTTISLTFDATAKGFAGTGQCPNVESLTYTGTWLRP